MSQNQVSYPRANHEGKIVNGGERGFYWICACRAMAKVTKSKYFETNLEARNDLIYGHYRITAEPAVAAYNEKRFK